MGWGWSAEIPACSFQTGAFVDRTWTCSSELRATHNINPPLDHNLDEPQVGRLFNCQCRSGACPFSPPVAIKISLLSIPKASGQFS